MNVFHKYHTYKPYHLINQSKDKFIDEFNDEDNLSLQTSEQTQWNIPVNLVSTVGVDILSGNFSLDTNQHLYSLDKTLD